MLIFHWSISVIKSYLVFNFFLNKLTLGDGTSKFETREHIGFINLLNKYNGIDKPIDMLMIDIEGAEFGILRQLAGLNLFIKPNFNLSYRPAQSPNKIELIFEPINPNHKYTL